MPRTHELSFPPVDPGALPPRERSLDEIEAMIAEDYALFFDRESYEREKRLMSVDKPFVLDPPLDQAPDR